MIKSLLTGTSALVGRGAFAVKAHSPEILLVLGITGTVASTVLACRATLKVDEVLDAHKEKTDKINTCWQKVQDGEIDSEKYSEQDHQKDLVVTYTQTVVDFIKLYGPPVLLGAASIACIIGGHRIMMKRNVALVAAYKALDSGFKAYRKRVIAEHGEEADYLYKNGLSKVEVTEMPYTDEDGVKHEQTTKTIYTGDPNDISVYAKFYDESCRNWTKNAEYNLFFLKSQQTYFNNMLMARGHVFLNEVYDALGMDRTQAGAMVGWVLGDGSTGDGHIDFGIFDGNNPRARAFVNGYENAILLDFNVDGPIQKVFTKAKV